MEALSNDEMHAEEFIDLLLGAALVLARFCHLAPL
jgi:hypothetical protein